MAETPLDRLLDATLPHVAFEGWSDAALAAGCEDAGFSLAEARGIAPRGAVDLAVALHRRGDRAMLARMADADLREMRFSDRVAQALKFRVETMDDREAVRRATVLFSMPNHAVEGAQLIWETSDHVWNALGDESQDGNWYSKRAILSGVWGSTVLYWLGDDSGENAATFAFIDRRIENVMQLEKVKGAMRKNPVTKPFMDLQAAVFGRMKAPVAKDVSGYPGSWRDV